MDAGLFDPVELQVCARVRAGVRARVCAWHVCVCVRARARVPTHVTHAFVCVRLTLRSCKRGNPTQ